jgi:hypothetical protein
VRKLLRFGNACADVGVGPVVVLQGFEVVVFALKEGLGGDLGTGFGEGLLVDVEIVVGEALVGEELKLVVFLDGAVLSDNVLVGSDALAVLAFEDVGLAGGEACVC